MRSRFTKQQKFEIIMECRKSGLSDYQWCQQQNISNRTFYGWVQQLKRDNYTIPDSALAEEYQVSCAPDIVKLELVDEIEESFSAPAIPSPIKETSVNNYAIEIALGTASIKISNDISPMLLSTIMQSIGGSLY